MIGEINMRTLYLQAVLAWHRRLLGLYEDRAALIAAYRFSAFSGEMYRKLDGDIDALIAAENRQLKEQFAHYDRLDASAEEYQLIQCQCGKPGCTDWNLAKRSGL